MWLVSQIGSLGCDLPGCLVIRCNLSPPGNCFMKNTDTATCSDGRGGHKKNMLDSMGIGSTVVSGKPECFCLYPRQNSDTLQWFHNFDSAHCRRRCRRRCYTHPDILRQPCTLLFSFAINNAIVNVPKRKNNAVVKIKYSSLIDLF